MKLIKDYSNAKGYLKQLYESKELQARYYTSSYFIAEMQSISYVKSINRVIKKDLDRQCVLLNEFYASLT